MDQFVQLIDQYGYIALFPLTIIEGPIITMIGGFFVRLGTLNPFGVYAVVILGDIVGDMFYYSIGRFGKNKLPSNLGARLGITEAHLLRARDHFTKYGYRTIIVAKLLQGVGPVGLIAAGSAGMPYRRFMFICLTVSLVQSAVFLVVGVLFGHAYVSLSKYLNIYAAGVAIAALVILFIVFLNRMKKL